MKLHKLQVLIVEAGAGHHGRAITCAGVGRGAGEVRSAVASSGQNLQWQSQVYVENRPGLTTA